KRARHPYTHGLMGAIPEMGADIDKLTQIEGAMPRLTSIPTGCAFNPRCPSAFDRCREEKPYLLPVESSQVACWLYDETGARREAAHG
ncbi:MAG: methionine ABC transporter ATP-binding protein, partial [Alphaproteobacteria bacterium]|nr:methionine ABC transporter ATP-binding protein [Alphaproteobacteria bacterium]